MPTSNGRPIRRTFPLALSAENRSAERKGAETRIARAASCARSRSGFSSPAARSFPAGQRCGFTTGAFGKFSGCRAGRMAADNFLRVYSPGPRMIHSCDFAERRKGEMFEGPGPVFPATDRSKPRAFRTGKEKNEIEFGPGWGKSWPPGLRNRKRALRRRFAGPGGHSRRHRRRRRSNSGPGWGKLLPPGLAPRKRGCTRGCGGLAAILGGMGGD
jgi:hypothetical protein